MDTQSSMRADAPPAGSGATGPSRPEEPKADLDGFRDRSLRKGVNPFLYWTLRAILVPAFLIYLRMNRIGREHLPKQGPLLLASNHRSFLDPFVRARACARAHSARRGGASAASRSKPACPWCRSR
jgi:hypothetical protein